MKRVVVMAVVLMSACGGGGGGNVDVTMHVLRGAAGSGSQAARLAPAGAGSGLWFLSPDQAKVTIDSITFIGSGDDVQQVPVTGCQPTYQRSDPAFTPFADCTLSAPVGSWNGVTVDVSTTAAILIDDATSGLYTTADGLTTTAPAAADFATVTVPNNGSSDFPIDVYFDQPLDIGTAGADTDAGTATTSLALLVDMNHTVFANVSGATATFDTMLPVPPASVIAAPMGTGAATFYSTTGTAGNYDAGMQTGDDTGSVRLYYPTTAGQPGFASFVTQGPGEAYPLDATKAPVGGYLGRDSNGTICWANSAQDESWAHYSQFCEMSEVTTLGGTTTLRCQQADPAPLPTSGDTYASGCPAMSSPSFTETLTLVAD
jgi:hypothetical protein